MLSYPASLPLPERYLSFVASLIEGWRQVIGSPWRRLDATGQALLTLAYLFMNETFEALAAAFGVGVATAWRYVQETVRLLAGLAPTLTEACWQLAWSGPASHVVGSNFAFLDGTAVPIDRVRGVPDRGRKLAWTTGAKAEAKARAEQRRRQRLAGRDLDPQAAAARDADLNRLYYSGKHKCHTVNLQGLVDPYGRLVWVSDGLPGSTQDLAAAHTHGVIDTCSLASLVLLCDLGYVGAGNFRVLTGYRRPAGSQLTNPYKAANRAFAAIRARAEHGFAPLKRWRILQRARCCPRRIGTIAKAIHALLTRA